MFILKALLLTNTLGLLDTYYVVVHQTKTNVTQILLLLLPQKLLSRQSECLISSVVRCPNGLSNLRFRRMLARPESELVIALLQ